jgi:YggT family protein
MNINPFIDLFVSILSLFNFVLVTWIIISWLLVFNIINRHQPLVQKLISVLTRLVEPPLSYIRKYIPPIAGIDLSYIILFLAINFIKSAMYTYLYKW